MCTFHRTCWEHHMWTRPYSQQQAQGRVLVDWRRIEMRCTRTCSGERYCLVVRLLLQQGGGKNREVAWGVENWEDFTFEGCCYSRLDWDAIKNWSEGSCCRWCFFGGEKGRRICLICYYAARRKERGDGASLAICTQPREEEFLERRYIDMLACLFAAWSGLVKQTACSWDEGRREEKSRDCGGPSILVARAEQNAPAVRPGRRALGVAVELRAKAGAIVAAQPPSHRLLLSQAARSATTPQPQGRLVDGMKG